MPYFSLLLASAALFYFQVILFPITSTIAWGIDIFVISSIAFFGFALSTLVAPFLMNRYGKFSYTLLMALMGGMYLPLWYGARLLKSQNAIIDQAIVSHSDVYGLLKHTVHDNIYILSAVFAIPFFVYGLVLSSAFASLDKKNINVVIAVEYIGGAFGAIFAPVIFSRLPFTWSILFPCFAIAIATLALSSSIRKTVCTSLVVAIITFLSVRASIFEPKPHLGVIARDTSGLHSIDEKASSWNVYSRVSQLEIREQNKTIFALGGGKGHAKGVVFDARTTAQISPLSKMAYFLAPEAAHFLILFAGTGKEMIEIYHLGGGKNTITGVELNRNLIDMALKESSLNLETFFKQPNIYLVIDEARSFLEKREKKYDFILFSWSGATTAYYVGSLAHTAEFVYVREGLQAALDNLTDQGLFLIVNGNKLSHLASLKKLLGTKLANSVIVFQDNETSNDDWKQRWEHNRLLVKPSGFSEQDLAKVFKFATDHRLRVLYAPGKSSPPNFEVYYDLIHSLNGEEFLSTLNRTHQLNLGSFSDDYPFIFSVGMKTQENANDISRIAGLSLLLLLTGLVVAALSWWYMGQQMIGTQFLKLVLFFGTLGASFVFIQFTLLHRAILILGSPGEAYSLSLGVMALAFAAGALLFKSNSSFTKNKLVLQCAATAAVGIVIAMALEFGSPFVLPLAVPFKYMFLLLCILPMGVFGGRLLPMSLALASKTESRLIPWSIGVDSVFAVTASLIASAVLHTFGFSITLNIGVGLYLVLIAIAHVTFKD